MSTQTGRRDRTTEGSAPAVADRPTESRASVSLGEVGEQLRRLAAHQTRIELLGNELGRALGHGHRLVVVAEEPSFTQASAMVAHLCRAAAVSASALRTPSDAVWTDAQLTSRLPPLDVTRHARPGDVLLALTCERPGLAIVSIERAALALGMRTVGLSGHLPNPLHTFCCDAFAVESDDCAVVRTVHGVVLEVLAAAMLRGLDLLLAEPTPT
jgi:D-sedoheptulose 7-phosphate isomerase